MNILYRKYSLHFFFKEEILENTHLIHNKLISLDNYTINNYFKNLLYINREYSYSKY